MKTNYKYMGTQGFFWMMYCAVTGYAAYYLLDQGFSTLQIGIFTTIFAICTALMQIVSGRIADIRPENWKKILIILCIISIVSALLLCIPFPMGVKAVLFGLDYVATSCVMPLLNQISFYYSVRGTSIDFGKARGTGSLLYAVYSLSLGQLTVLFGSFIVPLSAALVSVIMLADILSMPIIDDGKAEVTTKTDSAEKSSKNKTNFIFKYKWFFVVWIAFIFFMLMHMMTNNYMLQIALSVGGNSGSMGVALAISAVAELPVMILFAKIIKRFDSVTLLIVSGAGFIIKALMYVCSTSVGMLYFAQVLQMISFAIFANASVYFSDEEMSEEDKATGQSFMTNTLVIGQIIGNLLGGALIESYSVKAMTGVAFAATIPGFIILLFAGLKLLKKRNS